MVVVSVAPYRPLADDEVVALAQVLERTPDVGQLLLMAHQPGGSIESGVAGTDKLIQLPQSTRTSQLARAVSE